MKVLIAGGGTAGHINPGIAVAKYLRDKKGAEILFVGTEKGFENKLVPLEGFELRPITVSGFRRKFSWQTFSAIGDLFKGLHQAGKILKEYQPDIVIGTGGYVCGPVLFRAALKKIPTLIHEQNAYPGVTNRILSRFVDAVAISFPESEKFLRNKKLVLTGNPVKNDILEIDRAQARTDLGLRGGRKLALIFGGSRGAENINSAVVDMLLKHYSADDFEIIYATGENQYRDISEKLWRKIPDGVKIVPYIFNMAELMGAADLVVSRAGAITLAELTALGIPAILIPSPFVTANHQLKNAQALGKNGAAVILEESELSGERLYLQMKSLLGDDDMLKAMSFNSKKMGILDATEKICALAERLYKGNI